MVQTGQEIFTNVVGFVLPGSFIFLADGGFMSPIRNRLKSSHVNLMASFVEP